MTSYRSSNFRQSCVTQSISVSRCDDGLRVFVAATMAYNKRVERNEKAEKGANALLSNVEDSIANYSCS